jgi:RNA polymerase sigma factor (sigma-70 family)
MSAIRGRQLPQVIQVGKLGEPLPNELPSSTSRYDPEIVLAEWQIDLSKVLDDLSERERACIEMRFGLNDGVPKTLYEIARVYGVTTERVNKIINATLDKLNARTDIEKNYSDFPSAT